MRRKKRKFLDIVHGKSVILVLKPFYRRYRFWLAGSGVVLVLLLFWLVNVLLTRAEVADFYPATCLGTWENPQNAQSEPENLKLASSSFMEDNSAFLDRAEGQVFCGQFVPSDYEGRGEVKNVGLTLIWDFEGIQNILPVSPEPAEIVPQEASSSDSGSGGNLENSEEKQSYLDIFRSVAFAQDASVLENASSSENIDTDLNKDTNIDINIDDVSSTEDLSSPAVEPTATELIDDQETGTSSAEEVAPEPQAAPPPPPDENFLEVKYSLDGRNWFALTRANPFNWKNLTATLPITTWEELRKVQISIASIPTTLSKLPKVFLDGMLLEVHYDLPPVLAPVQKEIIQEPVRKVRVREGLPVIDLTPKSRPMPVRPDKENFGSDEKPIFDFDLEILPAGPTSTPQSGAVPPGAAASRPSGSFEKPKTISGEIADIFRDFFRLGGLAKANSPELEPGEKLVDETNPIVAQILDSAGEPTSFQPTLLTINSRLRISVSEPERSFKPGRYKLKLWVLKGGVVYFTETDFTWGVLAVNFNKSVYQLGDLAKIGLGVLDDGGYTLCDAEVRVRVTSPAGKISRFSTGDGTIKVSDECGPNTVTNIPDYSSELEAGEAGTYEVSVMAQTANGTRKLTDQFEVEGKPMFDVERLGPTRIYPPSNYKMTIRVKANRDFKGEASEFMPATFEATTKNRSEEFISGETKTIQWPLELKTGEVVELSYFFKAPEISPELYKLGPFQFKEALSGEAIWQETRKWQIAADAVVNTGSLIVYGDTADANDPLNYRVLTSTSTWGGETSGVAGDNDIKHVVMKAAPTRNEFVAGYLMANGRLDFAQASGTTWKFLFNATSSAAQVCNATLGACNQTFDLAYEQLSGEALMVYGDLTTDGVIKYVTWDGNVTSSVSSFTFNSGSAVDTNWVRLLPRGARLTDQRSDEMMLLVEDNGSTLFAAYWDGTQFLASTTIHVLPENDGRPFDGAWETNSGNFVLVYASSSNNGLVNDVFAYREFSAGAWGNPASVGSFGDGEPSSGGYWVTMDADPLSNRIAAGFEYICCASIAPQDSEGIWKSDGATTGWTASTTNSTLESTAAFGQVQAAFERFGSGNSTSSALFTYNVAGTVDTADYRTWISGTGFGTGTDIPSGWTNDGNYRKLVPSPNDDEMMWVGVDSDNDLNAQRWDGTNWGSTSTEMNTAVGTSTNTNAGFENNAFDFAYKPYSPWSLNWRWYNGTSTADTPTDALAAENTSSTISSSSMKLRLRFNVAERGGGSQTDARKKLQFTTSTTPNNSSTVWTDVGNVDSSTIWRYFDPDGASAVGDDGGVVAATVLSSSTNAGWWTTSNNAAAGSNMDHASTTVRELEFPIEGNSATTGFTHYFRMYDVSQQSPVYRQQTSWPATPCAGASACTYPSILLSGTPSISSVTVNGGSSIVLTANTTTTVYVNYTLTDMDGCSDVFTSGNTTTTLYRSGLASSCTADNLNCYRVSTSTHNCGAGNSADATSTFNVYYFADATDASSSYVAQNWLALAEARDGSSNVGTGTSSGVELLSLVALDVATSSINYGTMSPSSTTGFVNQLTSVKNTGNTSSTIGVSGTALTQGSNKIATSSQHYASSTFLFGGSEGILSDITTTISGVTLNPRVTNATNTVSVWTDTTALPSTLEEHAAAAYNGYLYVFGGFNLADLAVTSTVRYAQINSNGTIGNWANTTALPSVLYQQAAATYNSYVYMIGGGGPTSTVSYAKFSANGTLGAWAQTTALPTGLKWLEAAAGSNGYLYVTGGDSGTTTSTVLYAQINSNGTIGSWGTTNALPNPSTRHQTVTNKGYIYNIPSFFNGGASITSTVVYAPLQSNGTIGNWVETTKLPFTLFKQKSVVLGDYIYNIAGKENETDTALPTQTVRVGTITGNGTISAWDATTDFSTELQYHAVAAWNGYIYVLGGIRTNNLNTETSTVKYGTVNNGNSQKDTFWGLGLTDFVPTGTYSGVNTFTAVFSP